MQSNTIIVVIVATLVAVAGVAGFLVLNNDDQPNKDPSNGEITDALNRKIDIPANLDNGIVTIGSSGPLRFVSIFNVADKVIEVDKGDITDNKNGRAYSYAYRYDKLKVDTQSHPDNNLETATVESIAKKEPSVVITNEGIWKKATENFEILSKKVIVVVLKDQQMQYMTENGKLAEFMTFNITLLGKVFKEETRAEQAIDGINNIIKDITSLKGTSSKKIYVAGVTISGSNTLNTTFPKYIPFDLTGSNNAYDGDSQESKVVLLPENFTKMDIDMIIIDPSSSDKIVEQDSQKILEYLYSLSEKPKIYITVPIVWDSINYDCALASAYVVEYLNYPGSMTKQQLEEKINNIFTTFYGTNGANVLKDMKDFFVTKSTTNGQEMPIFEEVTIQKEGSVYKIVSA